MEIYLDTETTGFNKDDQVIQIGVIDQDGKVLINTLVHCEKEVPQAAFDIHGISNEMLADAPKFNEIYPQLLELINKAEKVHIYNSAFDVRLLKQTCESHELTPFSYAVAGKSNYPGTKLNCVMNAYAKMFFDGEWVKLGEACHYENIDCSDLHAHDAVSDCEMTRRLLNSMRDHELKVSKRAAYRANLKEKKLALVPEDTSGFPDFGQAWRPAGYKTLSQLTKRDISKFEFAGTCCSTYGDKGYLFKPKETVNS